MVNISVHTISKESIFDLGFMTSSRMDVRNDVYHNEFMNIHRRRLYVDEIIKLNLASIQEIEIKSSRIRQYSIGGGKLNETVSQFFFIFEKDNKYALASHFRVLTDFEFDKIIPPFNFEIPIFVLIKGESYTLIRAYKYFIETIYSCHGGYGTFIEGCHQGICLCGRGFHTQFIIDHEGRLISGKYDHIESFYGKEGNIKASNFEYGLTEDISTEYILDIENPKLILNKTVTIEKLDKEQIHRRKQELLDSLPTEEEIERQERRDAARDSFYALTDGAMGDYEDYEGDIDDVRDYMGI